MSTSPVAKRLAASSGTKAKVVVGFYLITLLVGGFLLLGGGRLGMVVDLTATMFYTFVTVLFYALNRGA